MRVMMVFAALLLTGCGQSEPAPRLDQSSGEWSCHRGGAIDVFDQLALDGRITSIEWRDGVTIVESEPLIIGRGEFGHGDRLYIWPLGYCVQPLPNPSPTAAPG